MNVICWMAQRELARQTATGESSPGGWARRHAEGCSCCSAYWRDLARLSRALPVLLEAPPEPAGLEARVLRAIEATPAVRSAGAPVGAAVLTALAICSAIIVLAVTIHHRQTRGVEQRTGAAAGGPQVVTGDPDRRSEQSGSGAAQDGKATGASGRASSKSREQPRDADNPIVKILLRNRRKYASTPSVKAQAQPASPIAQEAVVSGEAAPTEALQALGGYFEATGNYRHAALAYSLASSLSNDAALEFAAGRAAERSGDIAMAVEHYTRLLGSYDPQGTNDGG